MTNERYPQFTGFLISTIKILPEEVSKEILQNNPTFSEFVAFRKAYELCNEEFETILTLIYKFFDDEYSKGYTTLSDNFILDGEAFIKTLSRYLFEESRYNTKVS